MAGQVDAEIQPRAGPLGNPDVSAKMVAIQYAGRGEIICSPEWQNPSGLDAEGFWGSD